MAARKPANEGLAGITFPTFAPTIILVDDEPVLVKYVSMNRGPENQYGIPWVMTVEGIEGKAANNDGEVDNLVNGDEYSLWLLHTVLVDRIKEGKPAVGERMAILKQSKRKSKSSDNDYTPYSVVFPDRAVEKSAEEFSWDDL